MCQVPVILRDSLEASMHFGLLIGTTGSHLSLLSEIKKWLLLVEEPAFQVLKECWLLSNHQRSSYSLGFAHFWTSGLPMEFGELEFPLDLTTVAGYLAFSQTS